MQLDVAVLASALGNFVGTVVISLSHFKEDAKEFIASTILRKVSGYAPTVYEFLIYPGQ